MSYKVLKGDTLSKIAKLHNMSLDELLQLNNISKDKANNINVGLEIKISKNDSSLSKSPTNYSFKKYITGEDSQNDNNMSVPFKNDYSKTQYLKDNALKVLRILKDAGYNLGTSGQNKDGVDGSWGNKSQLAFDQALKDGYVFDNTTGNLYKKLKLTSKRKSSTAFYLYLVHPMFGTSTTVTTPTTSNKLNNDPGLISDTFNWLGRLFPSHSLIGGLTERPYKGSEEEARKLGYKHYTENGFTRHKVDYSVPNLENMTDLQRSQAQIDKYGITQELVRDKSPVSSLVYNYAPGYGYNILRFIENVARDNKVRLNGQPTKKNN